MLTIFVLGILGLIVGSFLNVVILRKHVLTLGGRSACMSCDTPLRWYDLVPVVSWILLRGRCRTCGSSISVQYPLVEATTAVLFATVGGTELVYTPLLLLGALIAICLLIVIAAYDIRHTIIPDSWAYLFAGVTIAMLCVSGIPQGASVLFFALSGPIAALPLATLWFVSRGRWIGLGDAKLALGIGWLLGPVYGVVAVFFAFVVGAVVSVCILMPLPYVLAFLREKGILHFGRGGQHLTMKSEVAFGPFLVASCLIVWFSILYQLPMPI